MDRLPREYIPIIVAAWILVIVTIVYLYQSYSSRSDEELLVPASQLTDEQKLDILENLRKKAPAVDTNLDKGAILEDLSSRGEENYQYSEEGKLQILEGLKKTLPR